MSETRYHHVWLEDDNDAANVAMPDGSTIIISSRGSIIIHSKNNVNDGSSLADIEALQHRIEAMLQPGCTEKAGWHTRGRAVYEAALAAHVVDGPYIWYDALNEEEKTTWNKIAAAGG